MKRFKNPSVVAGAFALLAAAPFAHAAPVSTLYTGGDAGEGLDLQNDRLGFVYALDFRNSGGSNITVADVTFNPVTASSAPAGVTINTYGVFSSNALIAFELGASTNDNNLETIATSMVEASSGAGSLNLTLAVTAGKTYQLQILTLANSGAPRPANYTINGVTTFVNHPTVAGAAPLPHSWVVTDTFVAASSSLQIIVAYPGGPVNDSFPQGLTLEQLPEPASMGLMTLGGLALLARRKNAQA